MNEQTNIPEFTEKDKREMTLHNFDENPEITGVLIAIEEGTYGQQYRIQIPTGELVTIGTYSVLTSKINKGDIGKWIKVKYNGNVKSEKVKGGVYKDFDVFIKQ